MRYEFRCINHPEVMEEVYKPWQEQNEWTHGTCHVCGEPLELDLGSGDGHRSFFRQTFGKWTGVYEYDYGKKATWDLTPKGKIQTLKHQGVIRDPFDSGPAPVTNDHLVPEV